MIIFRILSVVFFVYFLRLLIFGGGGGFQWIWLLLSIISSMLSIKWIYTVFFSNKWVKVIVFFGALIFVITELLIIYNGFEKDTTEEDDYIIVLGAGIRGTTPSLILKRRMDKAYQYLAEHPKTIAIVTGGQGKGEDITEAEAMESYLLSCGVDENRIIIEDKARNTYENLKFSFEIIDKYNSNVNIGVVTSSFHLLRTKIIAKNLGKHINGYGVGNNWVLTPNYYVREFFGVIKELVTIY